MTGPSLSRGLKAVYVTSLRGLGAAGARLGLLRLLDRHVSNRRAHWLRSLFAIHDLDQMIALDCPWWSYGAIDAVERFLAARPGARVFEYGSGASTVWLARRAGAVTSVEHDPDWFAMVGKRVQAHDNVKLRHAPSDAAMASDPLYRSTKPGYRDRSFQNYAAAIERAGGRFELIVIDGRARVACLAHALPHLAPGGCILFDNSGRRAYRAAILATGAEIRRYHGLTPALPYPEETTLLTPAAGRR